jgi:hypothetical protein
MAGVGRTFPVFTPLESIASFKPVTADINSERGPPLLILHTYCTVHYRYHAHFHAQLTISFLLLFLLLLIWRFLVTH